MSRKATAQEIDTRDQAVLDALDDEAWLRPCEIADRTAMALGFVVAALRRLEKARKIRRQERLVPVYRGAGRRRRTTKPIVEFRRAFVPGTPPPFLPPIHPVIGARLVRGRSGCGG